jgi:hypothetical protein
MMVLQLDMQRKQSSEGMTPGSTNNLVGGGEGDEAERQKLEWHVQLSEERHAGEMAAVKDKLDKQVSYCLH